MRVEPPTIIISSMLSLSNLASRKAFLIGKMAFLTKLSTINSYSLRVMVKLTIRLFESTALNETFSSEANCSLTNLALVINCAVSSSVNCDRCDFSKI